MPEKTPGHWFSADSSGRQAAQLWFEGGRLHVENEAGERRQAPLAEVTVSSRLGNIPRQLTLPDGVQLSVADNDFIDRALAANNLHKTAAVVHRLERHWRWAAVLLAAAAAVVYAGAVVGIPKLAEVVAEQVPLSYLQEISQLAYDEIVDRNLLQSSRLPDAQRRRIEKVFAEVRGHYPDDEYDIRLQIHRFAFSTSDDAPGIANAFALPDGLIVVTDDLALKLQDDEIAAIIAHEIGHVRYRHTLRSLVQAGGVALFFTLVLGDFSGVILVPATLLQFKYSRDAEREADCHAYDYLKHRSLPPTLIGDALKKIERKQQESDQAEAVAKNEQAEAVAKNEQAEAVATNEQEVSYPTWAKFIDLLSTHPATHARTNLAAICRPAA